MKRWFSGDERTLGIYLVVGVLVMAFFRLDLIRGYLGPAHSPQALLLVATVIVWWTLLSRSFVWFDPAVLTWGDPDRTKVVTRRLAGGWLVRLLGLSYLLAVLAAIVAASTAWVVSGAGVLVGAALLAFGTASRPRTAPGPEAVVVLALAAFAVVVRPAPMTLSVLAGTLAIAGLLLLRPGPLPIADVTRVTLVDGWRDRVLRVSGVQFLDLALLLPAARPIRPRPITGALRLTWAGVLGRARHVPTAALVGLAAVAAYRTFPALPGTVVFALAGYLALVPLTAGLGELWRAPGRRRWVGTTDTVLRWHHLLVGTLLAAAWGVPVCLLGGMDLNVLVTVPVLAACAVRTMTRKAPTYDNLMPVDTGMGSMPVRLIMQTVRGPDLGVLALLFMWGLPLWGVALVVAATAAVAVFR